MPRIISTLSAPVEYSAKIKGENEFPDVIGSVVIAGGHGLVSVVRGETLTGVETRVSDEELRICLDDPVFKMHQKSGHIVVVEDGDSISAEAVNADMKGSDGSSPDTMSDYPGGEGQDGVATTSVQAVGGKAVSKKK